MPGLVFSVRLRHNDGMPKRSRKKPNDIPQPEPQEVKSATREKNPAAVQLGRLGGKKGGPARATKMTPEQRRESARKAAHARWRKK